MKKFMFMALLSLLVFAGCKKDKPAPNPTPAPEKAGTTGHLVDTYTVTLQDACPQDSVMVITFYDTVTSNLGEIAFQETSHYFLAGETTWSHTLTADPVLTYGTYMLEYHSAQAITVPSMVKFITKMDFIMSKAGVVVKQQQWDICIQVLGSTYPCMMAENPELKYNGQ